MSIGKRETKKAADRAITKERLVQAGYCGIPGRYEPLRLWGRFPERRDSGQDIQGLPDPRQSPGRYDQKAQMNR